MREDNKAKKFRQELGISIRRQRHKLNLSQETFADKAHIHRTYVSSIELGKVDVGVGVIYKIVSALDIPLSKLIKEVESNI